MLPAPTPQTADTIRNAFELAELAPEEYCGQVVVFRTKQGARISPQEAISRLLVAITEIAVDSTYKHNPVSAALRFELSTINTKLGEIAVFPEIPANVIR